MAYQFRSAGHQIIDSPVEADLVVVNTCAVTAAAASDSRQKIRLAARLGKASVVVTGCWGTLEPQAAHDLPGVEFVIPNDRKDTLVSEILGFPVEAFDIEPIAREPLPGSHARNRAFIKVQDGCDNHCTFCITRIARGPGRSRAVDEVIKDVKMAQNGNTQEIVLSGVHLGSWGHDFDQPDHLRHLIEEILNRTSIPRVRLSSLEPWDLDHDFFELWSNPRLCRHLHLPLQSGAVKTLKRMARNTTPDAYLALVTEARKMQPDMAITTDIIVGYPGESDEDHQESLEFVRKVGFAGGHVFTYSKREGTAAAKLGEQV
ncbi:MAG: MiaB/RimO family radical SAM methylthiotransferase, partial [Anaerolineaceae bacterium]